MKQILRMLVRFAQKFHGLWIQGPIEALYGPFLKGPMRTEARSTPHQWAGQTTLGSGSATATVSTAAVNSDSLISLNLIAAAPAAYIVQGQITGLVSADVTGTASTSAVYSGYAINISLQCETSVVSAGAGINAPLRINSIVDGVSFAVSTVNSQPLGLAAPTINWEIPRAQPSGLKVNTISSGTHFIVGWADGKARPMTTTVMWELKRTS